MDLQELLSRAGDLSVPQQRRVAAIVGSLVADAAGKFQVYVSRCRGRSEL